MGKKLPKQAAKVILLYSFKELYLTCKNLLGIIYHPFKTIKIVRRENDSLQTLLIFGLPFYFWLGGVGMVLVARFLVGIHLFPMGLLAKTLLFLTSFLAGAIFSYLAYWLIFYLKKKNTTI